MKERIYNRGKIVNEATIEVQSMDTVRVLRYGKLKIGWSISRAIFLSKRILHC